MTGPAPGDGDAPATPAPDASGAPPPVVRLVGTGHVFPLRRAVQAEVFAWRPAVVALELDAERMQGLLTPPREDQEVKQGIGYGLMARFQRKMAVEFGGTVGDEMMAAREAALLLGGRVALIDRPVRETYRKLVKELPFWERAKLAGAALLALVPGPWGRDDMQRVLQGDPTLVDEVGARYPTLIRVLLHERNDHMARALSALAGAHPRVMAVMGDAHVPGVQALLVASGVAVETVRLPELIERARSTTASHTWSIGDATAP